MSGYNPLAWRPPDDTDNAGMTINPLATQSAPQPGVSTSDAWDHITNKVGDFLAAQRADAEAKGLWNPETGFPTGNGLLDAIKQYSGAMLAGTTAPGGRGIIAYHGSPHDFDAFDMSKIGTGEGAQAYGHGLYFAGNEAVARGYRDALAPIADPAVQAAQKEFGAAHYEFDGSAAASARVSAAEAALRQAESQAPPGHMYQVHVNAEPGQFLDYDKPLNQQSAAVKQAIGKSPLAGYENTNLPGGQIAPQTVAGAQALAQHGIPGIRYLDAGSRAAGEGSHNYVMFDPKLVTILRKYGLLGIIGGAAAASGGQDQ